MKTLFKKLLAIITIISALTLIPMTSVSAADGDTGDTTKNSIFDSSSDCTASPFLGFVPWCNGLNIEDEESLKNGIWTIVANVLTDVTILAAYLVIGYVIYGGYLYIFSGGDSSKVATGKKTLIRAFIGLAIVMSASVIMGAIRIALVGGSGDISDCTYDQDCLSSNDIDMVVNLIQWVIGIAGAVSAIFVVYGGIAYITSSGDSGKLQKAKNTIIYALIGLAIVALAEVITAFVSNIIRDANTKAESSAYLIESINETTLTKEIHEII